MSATNYGPSLALFNVEKPPFIPSLDGNGVLYLLLEVLSQTDQSDAIDTHNTFRDAALKIKKLVPAFANGGQTYREVVALLEGAAERFDRGNQGGTKRTTALDSWNTVPPTGFPQR